MIRLQDIQKLWLVVMILFLIAASNIIEVNSKPGVQAVDNISFSTVTFETGQTIPKLYTADGNDTSPPLKWNISSNKVQSFALICDDPDAPMGTWIHWIIYDIPPDVHELSEGVAKQEVLPNGARQGKNSWGKIGYGGPSPPPGKPHRYFFKLFALDTMLNLKSGATKEQLLAAMKGHITAQAELMGTYGR